MGIGCERCERRDELDYCNLDDREKYFLMFMVDGSRREMTVSDDFLRRFRSEIPREIKLETRNGHSYTVEVAKYPDKLVLRAGWGAFVETYDLQIEDSVVLRYNGNSQFNVIVFDRFGREKASSVVADNAALSSYVQERHIETPETLDRSRGHSQRPAEMQSPTENLNRSQGNDQPVCMQLPTENGRCSEGHPQPMQMLSPTGSVDHFVGRSQPMQMQPPTKSLNRSDCQPQYSQPMQMQPPTETLNHSDCHPQYSQPMQLQPPTETLNHSDCHPQPMQMLAPTANLDHFVGHTQPMQMQPPTETLNHSDCHPQPMQILSPTANLDHFVGHTQPMEMQHHSDCHPQPMQMLSPTANLDHFVGHTQPMEMQPPTETLNHPNCNSQSVQMQLACERTKRQSDLQRDKSSQGRKTVAISPGDSLFSEDGIEVCDTPRYTLGLNTHLNDAQKKEVDQKVQSLHSDNPVFVSMMSKCNVTGGFTLSVSKQYAERYVGDMERSICLQRLGKMWEVYFGGRSTEKRIVSGWRKFVKDNAIEMGDICIFELLKKCKTCTMEVHILHAKEINTTSKIGCDRVQEGHKDATKTVDHSHSRPQLEQMQFPNEAIENSLVGPQPMQIMQLRNESMQDSLVHPQTMQSEPPSTEKRLRLQRGNSNQGNKRDSLSSEDIDHEIDALPEYITAHFTRLTQVQEKAVKKKVQSINSGIPVFVVVMQKTNVTGRFTLSISNKYVEKYFGGEVQSIWLQRYGQRCRLRFGRRPQDNSRIVSGWAKFVRDNEVKTGDICLFVPLKHRKLCSMRVHIITARHFR